MIRNREPINGSLISRLKDPIQISKEVCIFSSFLSVLLFYFLFIQIVLGSSPLLGKTFHDLLIRSGCNWRVCMHGTQVALTLLLEQTWDVEPLIALPTSGCSWQKALSLRLLQPRAMVSVSP